uniref:Uncharacterized protein n=1 Tax=Ignisphaera aggregans TaxID=334771 RepID=A0A7C5Z0C3_9CREN
MLFLGSGKIVKNYRILQRYFEIIDEMNIDKTTSLPSTEDIELISRLVKEGRKTLLELLDTLTLKFIPKVNIEAAIKVCKEVLGVEVSPNIAVSYIAKDLAGWALEIAENLGVIKINIDNIPS